MKDVKRAGGKRAAVAATIAAALAAGWGLKSVQVVAQGEGTTPVAAKPVVATPATRDAASMQNAFSDVAKAVEPAVVTITTEAGRARTSSGPGRAPSSPFGGGGEGGRDPLEEFFERFRDFGMEPNSYQKEELRERFYKTQQRGGGGLGSGMIYRNDGLILTNAHVVQGAKTVTVKLADGREFKKARVLGSDERTDVAVVKIDGPNLPTVKLGDSKDVNVGDWAIAIGNPFNLTSTLTVGVISATAREVPELTGNRSPGDFLQTDASINPGNSGGPLCDIYGRVVGINNAIYSRSGGNMGIGFAIPINVARDIADRLLKSPNGRIARGYLGVKISDVDDRAAGLGLPEGTKGVLVEDVSPNTPASRAKLQEGDVVTKFNGQTVTKSSELQRLVGDAPVNSTATLTVLRGDKTIDVKVRLDELKDEGEQPTTPAPSTENDSPAGEPTALGLKVAPLSSDKALSNRLKGVQGVLVTDVTADSAAATAGLTKGDVIERVGRTPVTTATEFRNAVQTILGRQAGEEKNVLLYINRRGERAYITVTVDKDKQ